MLVQESDPFLQDSKTLPKSNYSLKWDSRLHSKNVKIDKLLDKQASFSVKNSTSKLANAFTEFKSTNSGVHFEVKAVCTKKSLNNLSLIIIDEQQLDLVNEDLNCTNEENESATKIKKAIVLNGKRIYKRIGYEIFRTYIIMR